MSVRGNTSGKRPTVGEVFELALWLSGTETEEHLRRFREVDAPALLKEAADRDSVVLGPMEIKIKRPGEDRVPQVPQHIQGPDVRLILIEAPVVALRRLPIEAPGFIGDLTPKDLATLRAATRAAYTRQFPDRPALSDAQTDSVINALGPKAAVETLRAGSTVQ